MNKVKNTCRCRFGNDKYFFVYFLTFLYFWVQSPYFIALFISPFFHYVV